MKLQILLVVLVAGLVLFGCTQQTPPVVPPAPNYTLLNSTPPAPVVVNTPPPVAVIKEPPKPKELPNSNQVADFPQAQLAYEAEQTILKSKMDYRALCLNESMDLGTHIITLKEVQKLVQPATFVFEIAEEKNFQPFARVGNFTLLPGEYQRITFADGPDYAIAAKYDDNVKNDGSGCIGVTAYNVSG